MLPTLKINGSKLEENGFINAYIKDVDCQVEYENCVYLLFKPPQMDIFNHFIEDEYIRTKALLHDYDYEDGYVVLVYQLDSKFDEDFKLIRKGLYSKTSESFQKQFKAVKKVVKEGLHKDEITLQHLIFKKADNLRDYWESKIGVSIKEEMEVWEGWSDEKETLDLNKIK